MNAIAEPEYQLKHRLVGAAVLVVLAVVIIPLFLSEPALEANSGVDENGVALQTFRSRITPLNLNNVNGAEQSEQDEELSSVVVDSRKPALLDLTLDSEQNAPTAPAEEPKEEKTALVMTNNASIAEEIESKPAVESLSEPEVKTAPETEQKAEPETKVAAVKKIEEPKASDSAPINQEETADSGWVVRVGTFSKKANVDSVSTLLNNSGFSPKTKLVDTSLGKSTRVWLGPYAKRETANKISERLKSLIGEKGYVTRTNS